MTVRECVELAAVQLGIAEEVKAYLNGTATGGAEKAELLLTCFNLVENELALDYLPLFAEDEIESETGIIEFSALRYDAVRVTGVRDKWGNAAAFKLFPTYLQTAPGYVKITYTYTPQKKEIDEESDFVTLISSRLMSYGMAAEYSLVMGLFEDATVWDKKYKEGIEAAYKLRPCKRIKSRRWV